MLRLVAAAAAALVFAAGAALAQDGEHGWISNNELYKRADGTHCCGPEHCTPRDLHCSPALQKVGRPWIHLAS
jgi:hypothetical protein